MNKKAILSVCCAVFVVTACDHYSTKLASMDGQSGHLAGITPAAGGEMTFGQHLANEYYHLARYEQDKMYDYQAAKLYTEKAEQLSSGTMVSPSKVSDFKIEPEQKEELSRAREQLIDALTVYNVPENRYNLAMAQSRYDCWLEQQEESRQDNEIITCRNEFRHAMASLMPTDGTQMTFQVPFEEGSMVLSEEARVSIGRALSFWRVNQGKGGSLTLRPVAGVSQEEVERQVSMVRSILQFNGIPASAIEVGAAQEMQSFEIFYHAKEAKVAEPQVQLSSFRDINPVVFILIKFIPQRTDRDAKNFRGVCSIAKAMIQCV